MIYTKYSRRTFLYKLGGASLIFPFGTIKGFPPYKYKHSEAKQDYHFSQANVTTPAKLQTPDDEKLFSGFQAIARHTPVNGIICQPNNLEASVTTYNELFKKSPNGITTVQFQNWWGRNNGIKAWDGKKYGYSPNNVKVSFGAMVKIPQNTGDAIGYATFYLRGQQFWPTPIAYWIQVSVFDDRGYNAGNQDILYVDGETKELSMESQLNQSKYSTKNPDSNVMLTNPFSDFKFFGASISRQQLYDLMVSFKAEYKKRNGRDIDLRPEPDLHSIFAFGVTPEIAEEAGKKGGVMKMTVKNLFLRTDY